MNWNKFLIAGVVGAVVAVVVGYVWHRSIFGAMYMESRTAISRPEIIMWIPLLGEVLRGFLLAFIYPFGYKGGVPWMEGLRFGVLMGLLSAIPALIYSGVFNFTSWTWFWLELIGLVVQCALVGIAIAYVYGKEAGKAR